MGSECRMYWTINPCGTLIQTSRQKGSFCKVAFIYMEEPKTCSEKNIFRDTS
jgi:hypothetical protein